MVRKQFYITDSQDMELASRAKSIGVSQAEVVRIAIEQFLEDDTVRSRAAAWSQLDKLLDEAAETGAFDGLAAGFNRDDLYDR